MSFSNADDDILWRRSYGVPIHGVPPRHSSNKSAVAVYGPAPADHKSLAFITTFIAGDI